MKVPAALEKMAAKKKTAAKAKGTARVTKSPTEVTQLGLKAQGLLTKNTAQLTPRLPTTLAANLSSDLASMGVVVPAVQGAKEDASTSTAAQASELEQGFNLVTAVRASVARDRPAKGVRLAYGVGLKMSKSLVKDVTNALQRIVNRATAQPAEAAGYGVTAADVTLFTAQIAAIKEADQAQSKPARRRRRRRCRGTRRCGGSSSRWTGSRARG